MAKILIFTAFWKHQSYKSGLWNDVNTRDGRTVRLKCTNTV